ncbi:FixH family protein [Arenibacter sp. GZD96]|uniref:FixH family protein n=1 Tax=Aurantibrevibacter litoralis TaxID=3106030 RepID=UPI002B0492C7|nr:FixH family protein [Arenibacter sp. GZD-96]MEA1785213.1 FixH family protein [Arenibacter sp. GZD-96]
MKINWGTGIVLAFVGFISFILFFVIRMSTDSRTNHDLVTEEYYKAELGYQQEIDAARNARDRKKQISIKKTSEGLLLIFPENVDPKLIQGTVSLYRPSNKHLDVNLPISLSNAHLLIPDQNLLEGRWDISVFWEYENQKYLHKESITY